MAKTTKHLETRTLLDEWLATSPNIHARLASLTTINETTQDILRSSMAPDCTNQSTAALHVPSLYGYSEATPTETSISTGLAEGFAGVPLLEEVHGVLEKRPSLTRPPLFECSFWFLSCTYISDDPDEWKTHCLSHFRGQEPPRSTNCTLCDFQDTSDDGWSSWNNRQNHVAQHFWQGITLKNCRPDFHLFQHLWEKRLIGDLDLKELKSGNHSLCRTPSNFVTTQWRRERDMRSQRSQHVGLYRQRPTSRPPLGANPKGESVGLPLEARISFSSTEQSSLEVKRENLLYKTSGEQTPMEAGLNSTISSKDSQRVVHESTDPSTRSNSPESTTVSETASDAASISTNLLSDSDVREPDGFPAITAILPSEIMDDYFTRLLHSFKLSRQKCWHESVLEQEDGHDPNGPCGKRRAASPPSKGASQKRPSKRNQKSDRNDADEDRDEDDQRPNRSRKLPPNLNGDDGEKDRLFACPFVKRYPKRYLKCFSHKLTTISRVKLHLSRHKAHRLPLYCPRCSETFEMELARDTHIRDAKCATRPQKVWEGITEFQRGELKKRSISAKTPEANWFEIFEILFPGDPSPVDPYIDEAFSAEIQAFREHLLSGEGRQVWYETLEERLPAHLRQYVEELQLIYDSLYTESIVRLCESWNSRTPAEERADGLNEREVGLIPIQETADCSFDESLISHVRGAAHHHNSNFHNISDEIATMFQRQTGEDSKSSNMPNEYNAAAQSTLPGLPYQLSRPVDDIVSATTIPDRFHELDSSLPVFENESLYPQTQDIVDYSLTRSNTTVGKMLLGSIHEPRIMEDRPATGDLDAEFESLIEYNGSSNLHYLTQ